ncbi:MAG TPA: SUF system NifU family Fe-S cluster assembly protein [Candidatus Eisenbacteria bacterium]|nr:SUF system NifU family Fe-S cluster assembly protein [Candidatus Eisenbacteria bacterium]
MEPLHEDIIGDEEMYRENILDHYREPHNAGRIEGATFSHRELNPSCGDTIEMYVKIADGRVADVKFDGHGCAISQASVSMLTDHVKGMDVAALRALTKEDVFRLLGVQVGMTRLRCALLGLKTLEVGLQNHLNGKE